MCTSVPRFQPRTVVINKTGTENLIQYYCNRPNMSACAPFNQPGTAFSVLYTGVVSFSAAEISCKNWYLSVNLAPDSRPATANLSGTAPFYLEAYLNLTGANSAVQINNNSVEYSPLNHPYLLSLVNSNQIYSLNGAESDGDSVVYKLKPALQGPGAAVAYQAPYSFQSPVASSVPVTLNPVTGEFRFKPNVFVPNTPPGSGQNRYAVVFQAEEYRKINQLTQLVGYTQRDMIMEIVPPDTTVNHAPGLANFT